MTTYIRIYRENALTCPQCGKKSLKQAIKADWCDECGYYQGYP